MDSLGLEGRQLRLYKKTLLPGFSQTMQQPTPQDALRSPFGETLLSSPTYVFFYTYKSVW